MEREKIAARTREEDVEPISEISLENTVDREALRLETEIGAFAATLRGNERKTRSFLDRLRDKPSLRAILALIVGMHLAGVKESERPHGKPNAPEVLSYPDYKDGMTQTFLSAEEPLSPPVTVSSSDTTNEGQSEQSYAPQYEAPPIPSVEKDAEMIESFIHKNSFKKYKVTVIGFASFEGDYKKNKVLSQDRAELAFAEVRNNLERAGLDTRNLEWEIVGGGERIELNGKEISLPQAYDYLQKELGVRNDREVDAKIRDFNDGKFDHAALQELLVKMRGHRVTIEGIPEPLEENPPLVTTPHSETTPPSKKVEEIPVPEPKKFSESEDLLLRLPRRRRTKPAEKESVIHLGYETPAQIRLNRELAQRRGILREQQRIASQQARLERIKQKNLAAEQAALQALRMKNDVVVSDRPVKDGFGHETSQSVSTGSGVLERAELERMKLERMRLERMGVQEVSVVRKGDATVRTEPVKVIHPIRGGTQKINGSHAIGVREIGGKVPRGTQVFEPVRVDPPIVEPITTDPPVVEPPDDDEEEGTLSSRAARGKRRDIQAMKIHRPAEIKRSEKIDPVVQEVPSLKKQPQRKERPQTGRGRVILDDDLEAKPLPPHIDYDRNVTRGSEQGKISILKQKESRDLRSTRKLIAKNESDN